MKYLSIISTLLTLIGITIGVIQLTKNTDIVLHQPGPPPPPQYEYLKILPGVPNYIILPPGYPQEYYNCPQFYFYYEPCAIFYKPGISVFIGFGWWFTPGCGLVNVGWYHPINRPLHTCPSYHTNVVKTQVNISNTYTTINIQKTINTPPPNKPNTPPLHPNTPNKQPPPPNKPNTPPPHKEPPPPNKPNTPPPHPNTPNKQPPHKEMSL